MDFLSQIAGDLKSSATKAAAGLYTTTRDAALAGANKLFGAYTGGAAADLAKGTIPITTLPQAPALSAAPLSPVEIAGAARQPDYSKPLMIAAAILAALFLFKRN